MELQAQNVERGALFRLKELKEAEIAQKMAAEMTQCQALAAEHRAVNIRHFFHS